MRQLVFTNRKGGCAKTTTSVNVAAALADMGHTVLLVDTDPQAHATMSLGISQSSLSVRLNDVLLGNASASDAVYPTAVARLHLIPSSRQLTRFERENANNIKAYTWQRHFLSYIMEQFEFTIFDTPPTIQLLTISALIAGQEVFIPMQMHFLAMEGMIEIIEMVQRIRRHYNRTLKIRGIIPTFYQRDVQSSTRIMRELRTKLGAGAVLHPIAFSNELAESPGAGVSIFQYSVESNASHDYSHVAKQILHMGPLQNVETEL